MNESPWRSAFVSLGFGMWTVLAVTLGFAVSDGAASTPAAFASWFGVHWWGVLVGLVLNPAPLYRARQALTNAQKGA